ncbi:UNVERIFIED_CONTAM: hypothetical protein Scaly_3154200 [Sesamum calycinum]|uniref:Reverse transcriptase domain-containing protein n=1 Tax=Sesamum calycinum TaxID=2727403 RepID=A0AAW2JFV7_9LAMI
MVVAVHGDCVFGWAEDRGDAAVEVSKVKAANGPLGDVTMCGSTEPNVGAELTKAACSAVGLRRTRRAGREIGAGNGVGGLVRTGRNPPFPAKEISPPSFLIHLFFKLFNISFDSASPSSITREASSKNSLMLNSVLSFSIVESPSSVMCFVGAAGPSPWLSFSTATFSVALNGSIYGFFPGARGLRQGDPMSPYLFVLVMEIWNTLLRYRVQNAPQFQHHWKCRELNILTICFADDVLIFCKAHPPSATVIKDTLCEFSVLSGLNVNPTKSQIILSRAAQQNKQQLLDLLGFQEGCLPVRYLGVQLTSSRLTVADCRPLLNTLESRLEGWNQLNLSFAGRAQIIKSVLCTLHAYWASVFILPKGIIKTIEARIRKFLWQGPAGRGVGNGESFKLWMDIWHENGPLCLSYPRGPTITGLPLDASLSCVLQNGHWRWPSRTDQDISEIAARLPHVHHTEPDSINWKNRSGKFTVQSAVSLIQPPSPHVKWHVLLQGVLQFYIERSDFNGHILVGNKESLGLVNDGEATIYFMTLHEQF